MSNQVFQQYGGSDIMSRFNEFKKNFTGDPQKQVQQMLNSGKITQAQYNQAVQKANMLRQMFGI